MGIASASSWLETSFSIDELGPQRAAEMIEAHGAEKVLFGTDWPWQDQATMLEKVRALPLAEATIDRMLWSNSAKLLGF